MRGAKDVRVNARRRAFAAGVPRSEKPANLPVQAPRKYELVVGLKTAKLFGPRNADLGARARRRDIE